MSRNPDRRETLRPLSVTCQYLQHRIRQGEGWTFKNQCGVRRLAGGPWTGFCRKRGRSWRREGCRLLVRGPGRKNRHDPGVALGACLSGVPSSLCAADVGSFLRQLLPAQCLTAPVLCIPRALSLSLYTKERRIQTLPCQLPPKSKDLGSPFPTEICSALTGPSSGASDLLDRVLCLLLGDHRSSQPLSGVYVANSQH